MHCICILYTCQDLWTKKILDYARNFNLVVCDLGVYRTKQKVIKYHYYNPGNVSWMKKHKCEIISCDLTIETYHVSRPKLPKSKFLEKKILIYSFQKMNEIERQEPLLISDIKRTKHCWQMEQEAAPVRVYMRAHH